ncbi:MFS family permease [Pseudomonas syringae pv. actinidiae]|uniref:MFS family permease n=1 Tax=Pseudomonas syringae pv. actinidiae TaxID=103796 RepID=A0A2V0Q9L7_PSESF|nr:MFS family permease [Pseudomonas syringae pv. actinidiae]
MPLIRQARELTQRLASVRRQKTAAPFVQIDFYAIRHRGPNNRAWLFKKSLFRGV